MPISPTQAIKARALELGFDKVGVARAGPADPRGHLRAWLDRGYDAGLSYMSNNADERADTTVLMDGARSVVALAISYYWEDAEAERSGPIQISRYAQGRDYHKVVRRKIRKLRKFMLGIAPDARVHPTVDTSPVLEREWAQRAGIAWIGKSTMAIAQDLGTYTFLATLVTTMELEYDEPHLDRCGSCTACLDACPTGAFVEPRVLDARRCITYWNVEHQGEFDETTPDLHGWLAGCDICQEVCPWNKFARTSREPRFEPGPELTQPDILKFRDDPSWVEKVIEPTALKRTGREALSRNAKALLRSVESDTDD